MLIMLVVLSVVAGGGWLVKVSGGEAGGGVEAYTYRGPQPAAHQEPVTPEQRREQTKGKAKSVEPHALPATKSKPATAEQIRLLKANERKLRAAGPKASATSPSSARNVSQASLSTSSEAEAAASYNSGALYQVSADPFGNAAAQQGGWLSALGNHIGAAVPGEPLQVKAAIWQSGGADDEVHPVKVRWKVDYYGCRLNSDDVQWFDFGQTVQAPTLNTDKVFPEVNATFTVPTTECTKPVPSYTVWACTTVTDDPTDTESCGSYNMFYIVPSLPDGAACAAVCGDASGAAGTTVMRADPVNTATGAFTEVYTDARIPAPGVPFSVGRVYSSDNTFTGALGKGWQLPWETRLQIASDGNAVLVGEGGTQHAYTKASGGKFTAPAQARSTLAADGTGYKLTTADHATYSFNGSGRLTALKDRTGRGLTLAYTGGKPTAITDAVGRQATLAYTGDRLDKVTLADGRFVDYSYTGDRRPATGDRRPATGDRRPATGDRRPADRRDRAGRRDRDLRVRHRRACRQGHERPGQADHLQRLRRTGTGDHPDRRPRARDHVLVHQERALRPGRRHRPGRRRVDGRLLQERPDHADRPAQQQELLPLRQVLQPHQHR
ncbi:DUF6531 domain-containing protein [Streptomyces olivaceus]|uniref:DUF6531 domain-containing protein n=1 Tax=Streptomyces olivaceus TaxID=47716 RepID=UPI003717B969